MRTEGTPAAGAQPPQKPFVISRVFAAARTLVWKTWTDSHHMQWWGPKGVTIHYAKMDLRPGGTFHYCMKTGDGGAMWGRWVIRDFSKPDWLEFVSSFSDEAGGLTRHPMSAHWPLEILSNITFAELDGKTKLTVRWLPVNATEEERRAFDEGHESMKSGWSGTLDRLEEYLAKVQENA